MKLPRALLTLLSIACLSNVFTPTAAQDYPTKPIQMIVGFAAGGVTDIVSRVVAQGLSEQLKQQVIINNKPGGGTKIAVDAALLATPDGYTVMAGSNSYSNLAGMFSNLGFDPLKDFIPIAIFGYSPAGLIIRNSLNINSIPELIAYAKANPDKLKVGLSGLGSGSHLQTQFFMNLTGTKMRMVPYKGAGDVMNDLKRGEVDMIFTSLTSLTEPTVMRALAQTGARRSSLFPDIPTLNEFLPGYAYDVWSGLLAPRGTPPAIVDRLHQATSTVLKDPQVVKRLNSLGIEPVAMSQDAFAKFIAHDIAMGTKLLREAGIKPQ